MSATLPTDYQAALDYIFNYVDYERRRSVPYTESAWNLDRARQVLAALGNPHQDLRYVHVAGSKGKGSTAATVESVLRASGLRVGFYTSPHLHSFRERIRVDGELLAREDLVRLLDQCRPAVEAVPGITTFEIITVIAFLHFAQQQVDWVVLEVGLGGRLDATNVVTPVVSVITPISYEHTALLGDTLDQIAREKAGIIKPGVPVVIAPQEPEALAAFEEIAQRQAARLVLVGRDWRWRSTADTLAGQTFDVTGPVSFMGQAEPGILRDMQMPLLGPHQLSNATTAIAACAEAACAGAPISERSLREGVATVYWPGRLEVLTSPPTPPLRGEGSSESSLSPLLVGEGPGEGFLVLDSAHNAASARLLRSALATYFPGRALRLVIGVSNDKDVDSILAELVPGAEMVIAVRSRHPRAVDAAELAGQIEYFSEPGRVAVAPNVDEAIRLALEGAGRRSVVCVAGSLFVASEAREAWLRLYPDSLPAADWARQAEAPDPKWQVVQTPARS